MYFIPRPQISFSTITECLNALLNVNNQNRDFIARNLATIVPSIIPWLFHNMGTRGNRIRQLSLKFLLPLTSSALPVLADNAGLLLNWYANNQLLPSHPLAAFLGLFFRSGIKWNVADFTGKICDAFGALPGSSIDSMVTSLWIKLATPLLSIRVNVLFTASCEILTNNFISQEKDITLSDKRVLTFLVNAHRHSFEDESAREMWCSLFAAWSSSDPTILASVLNPLDLEEMSEVDLETIRFLLQTLRFELPSLLEEMKHWIRLWVGSWNKSRNIATLDKFRHVLQEPYLASGVWEFASSELTACGFVQTESSKQARNISHSIKN